MKAKRTAHELLGELSTEKPSPEQVCETQEKIDAKLTSAINSGKSKLMTAKDWDRIRTVGRRTARRQRMKR
jgi:hypothetical protein